MPTSKTKPEDRDATSDTDYGVTEANEDEGEDYIFPVAVSNGDNAPTIRSSGRTSPKAKKKKTGKSGKSKTKKAKTSAPSNNDGTTNVGEPTTKKKKKPKRDHAVEISGKGEVAAADPTKKEATSPAQKVASTKSTKKKSGKKSKRHDASKRSGETVSRASRDKEETICDAANGTSPRTGKNGDVLLLGAMAIDGIPNEQKGVPAESVEKLSSHAGSTGNAAIAPVTSRESRKSTRHSYYGSREDEDGDDEDTLYLNGSGRVSRMSSPRISMIGSGGTMGIDPATGIVSTVPVLELDERLEKQKIREEAEGDVDLRLNQQGASCCAIQ